MINLGKLEIETSLGDLYLLPAMDRAEVEKALPRGPVTESMTTLALINASFAVLSIPFRIIKVVRFEGDVLWTSSV